MHQPFAEVEEGEDDKLENFACSLISEPCLNAPCMHLNFHGWSVVGDS